MSDRPNDKKPDEPEKRPGWKTPETGGWRTANQPGEQHTWRTPNDPSAKGEGWRVPMLPRDLGVTPEDQGVWHLPRPQDTTYSPEDEGVIATTPDQPPPEAAAPAAPADQTTAPADAPAPVDDTQAEPPAPALEPVEDEDEDNFSMSELVALASLVDNVPSVEVRPAPTPAVDQPATTDQPAAAPDQSEEMAGASDTTAPPVVDPAEYARQQLDRLRKQQAAAEAAAAAQPKAADQPAPAAAATQPAPPISPRPPPPRIRPLPMPANNLPAWARRPAAVKRLPKPRPLQRSQPRRKPPRHSLR